MLGAAGAIGNRDTAVLRDRAISVPGGAYCLCPLGPWCGGPSSADWADCAAPRCKPCRLPAPLPIDQHHPSTDDAE
jgi:hypothetical protein